MNNIGKSLLQKSLDSILLLMTDQMISRTKENERKSKPPLILTWLHPRFHFLKTEKKWDLLDFAMKMQYCCFQLIDIR